MLSIMRVPSTITLECAGGEHTEALCHQTSKPQTDAMEDTRDYWSVQVVAEYPTTSGMATDMTDIVDAMYRHAEEHMHSGSLCMD